MLQINLKHFLYFLYYAIYKSRSKLKIVTKQKDLRPKVMVVVLEVMPAAAVHRQQKELFLALKTPPEL
jgi:hypothetical protein